MQYPPLSIFFLYLIQHGKGTLNFQIVPTKWDLVVKCTRLCCVTLLSHFYFHDPLEKHFWIEFPLIHVNLITLITLSLAIITRYFILRYISNNPYAGSSSKNILTAKSESTFIDMCEIYWLSILLKIKIKALNHRVSARFFMILVFSLDDLFT